MSGAGIDGNALRSAFDRCRALVEVRSGHPIRGFDEGLAAVWESYKPRLRDHALGLLRPEDWLEGEIGSGAILNRTVEAIEIQDSRLGLTNNLVFWQNRYGHANRDHRAMLEAASNPVSRGAIEALLFGLYLCTTTTTTTTITIINGIMGLSSWAPGETGQSTRGAHQWPLHGSFIQSATAVDRERCRRRPNAWRA